MQDNYLKIQLDDKTNIIDLISEIKSKLSESKIQVSLKKIATKLSLAVKALGDHLLALAYFFEHLNLCKVFDCVPNRKILLGKFNGVVIVSGKRVDNGKYNQLRT